MATAPTAASHASDNADSAIFESLAELPNLLLIARGDRPKDWQEIVGRHVSALSADYPRQSDENVALREISLITLAAQKGSNDAKKRALKPARWISNAPPAISDALERPEEARAAIRVLQPLKGTWTVGYVQRELTRNRWPNVRGELLAWQLRDSATIETFLGAINGTEIPVGASASGWIAGLLQIALKAIAKARLPSGSGFMAEIEKLASKAAASGGTDPIADQRERRAAQRAVVALISQRSSVDPAVLVQGGAIAAIRSLVAVSKSSDAAAIIEFESLCRRLIALAGLVIPLADRAMLSHLRKLWSAYRECTPHADQLLRNVAMENRALHALEAPEDEVLQADFTVTPAIEGVLTELMSNWDSYSSHHRRDPAVRQLSARIEDLVRYLGIVRFGAEGEVVPFDPLRHHLAGGASTAPARVVIRRPGIALQRPDGTSRVLVPAVVSPA